MRQSFGREQLEKSFNEVGSNLKKQVKVFLIGGGAMCFRNQKNATKDIDLVCLEKEDAFAIALGLETAGFVKKQEKILGLAYEKMKAQGIWENKDGFRVDLFVRKVCNALELSDSMAARAKKLETYGKLEVLIISDEDIVFFKGITERERDSEDMADILRLNPNIQWQIILDECEAQRKHGDFYGLLYNKFQEIKEKFGVEAPIIRELLKKDREIILGNAYGERRKTGMNHEQAINDLEKHNFSKKEIEKSISKRAIKP